MKDMGNFEDMKNERYTYLNTAVNKDGWLILGPGGGGRTLIPVVSPHDPDTVLVSCDMTAGYITRDGGNSWREFNLKSRFYSFAFDPVHPDTIYAGACGLYRSTDGGQLWQLVFPEPSAVTGEKRAGDEANYSVLSKDNWPGGRIEAIRVDPLNTEQLYLGVNNGSLNVFFSENYGDSWVKLLEVQGEVIHQIYADPRSPVNDRRLFVFTDECIHTVSVYGGKTGQIGVPVRTAGISHASCAFNKKSGKTLFYITTITGNFQMEELNLQSRVWKSDNEGGTWKECITGLEADTEEEAKGIFPVFSLIAASEYNAETVYLVVEKLPQFYAETGQWMDRYGVLKSIDEGENWDWTVNMSDFSDPPNRDKGWAEQDYGVQFGDLWGDGQISPKGRFIWGIGVAPSNPDVCYTTDFSSIYRTKDGGEFWNQTCSKDHPDGSVYSRGIDVTGFHGLIFDPFSPEHMVLPYTDGGMFHSLNSGRTWVHAIMDVPREWINTCYSMVFDPEVKGKAWSVWAALHDIPRRKMFDEELFTKYKGGICRSEDGGLGWQASRPGLPEYTIPTHLVLDTASSAGKRTLYAAAFHRGVYKSMDDGCTWELKNNGIIEKNPYVWRITLLPDGTMFLIIVRSILEGKWVDGAIYKSVDGAEAWSRAMLPEGVGGPNDLIFDPSEPQRMYLSCWPKDGESDRRYGGLHVTNDGGDSWSCIFDAAAHVYSAAIDPENPETLYAATFDAGVFRSDDRGKSWRRLKGCNFQWYYKPVPDPVHKGMLYLTTFGSGLWYGPAAGVEKALEDCGTV